MVEGQQWKAQGRRPPPFQRCSRLLVAPLMVPSVLVLTLVIVLVVLVLTLVLVLVVLVPTLLVLVLLVPHSMQ